MQQAVFTVGIDVGGTFTDLVAVDRAAGRVLTAKHPSRPDDPVAAILSGMKELGIDGPEIERLVHGTTIATNALLERRGATTGLLTTSGCRDVIEIGRGRRLVEGGMFDVRFRRPGPLVPRQLRLEVGERCRASGEVILPLSVDDVRSAAALLREQKVAAVAICFLHSYRFPEHERQAERLLRDELGPSVYITLSATVNPQFREFERFSTTVANAYVGPKVIAYLRRLAEDAGQLSAVRSTYVMGSAGGIMDRATAALLPVRTILSGPAGGVVGARLAAAEIGLANVIACDMGGTSTDVALLQDNRPTYAGETIVSGIPIRASQIDINTIGAGAGSIIAIDGDGALAVGPSSAGAFPGPACYGNGGTLPTVTDANVVLGRIAAGTLLGGQIRVDDTLAERAFAEIRRSGGFSSAVAAAEGALEILVAKTARAIREISLQRGFDPRDFALVAFGGAGPMHAAGIAEAMGITTILIPNHAGILSAVGLARAAIRREATMPYLARANDLDDSLLRSALAELGEKLFDELRREGASAERTTLSYLAEARCVGQSHELVIELGDTLDEVGRERIEMVFEAAYEHRYGRTPETAIELVQLRVLAETAVDDAAPYAWRGLRSRAAVQSGSRRVWFRARPYEASVLQRQILTSDARFDGPCIIEEAGATTVVPPGWKGRMLESGHLLLSSA